MAQVKLTFLICMMSLCAVAQESSINVKVIDEYFTEIPFCDVFSVDDTYYNQTDELGMVTLPDEDTTMRYIFSLAGYVEDTISIYDMIKENFIVTLLSNESVIKEIIVTAPSRKKERLSMIPSKVDVINADKIYEYGSQTSADILSQSNEVFVQKSQMGGGSPVIRGFEASKVLLVMDGVRLNNAIYRSGHLQNAITVDPLILDRAEVVFGPSAVVYGSDALGGVVHYYTKDPKFSQTGKSELHTNGYLKYSSANFEKRVHGDVEVRNKKWSLLSSISVSNFEDLRAGQNGLDKYGDFGERPDYVSSFEGRDTILENPNPHIQIGTGYEQYDFLQKARFLINDSTYFGVNVNYSTSSDVPRYDRLIEETDEETLKFANWSYGPQKRLMTSLSTQLYRENHFFSKANMILAYQKIDEDRINRSFNNPVRSVQEEDVHILSFNADFNKYYSEKKRSVLNYGVELKHDIVKSNSFEENLITDEIERGVLTRYPDGGSTMSSAGMYATSDWSICKHHRILVGARYTFTYLNAKFRNELYMLPFDKIDLGLGALTGSIGYAGEFSKGWNIRTSVSNAFRMPNVDDFGKVRVQGGNVTIPNDELTSEKSMSIDFGLSKTFNQKVKISGNFFYTYLFDAIARDTFSLSNGDTLLVIQDETNRVTANINSGKANVLGGNMDLEVKFNRNWSSKSSITYTRGRKITEKEPLGHIPPLYGGFDVTYKKDAIRSTLAIQFNGAKRLEDYDPSPDSPDNLDLATEDGTPSWWILNWYASVKVAPKLLLHLGVENILDRKYKPFSSGISGAGRNVIAALHTSF